MLFNALQPWLLESISSSENSAKLALAQIPFLPSPLAEELVERIVTQHSSVYIPTEELPSWSTAAREKLLSSVISQPKGRNRVEQLMAFTAFLPNSLRSEVLDAILDGTAPEWDESYGIPYSQGPLHEGFLRTLTNEQKERWISHKRKADDPLTEELIARAAINHWPREAIERCWNAVRALPTNRGLPTEAIHLVAFLPEDLLTEALQILREKASVERRRYFFARVRSGLTDAECEDTIANPWNELTRDHDTAIAHHLCSIEHLLPRGSPALIQRWIDRARKITNGYHRQTALAYLYSVAPPAEQQRIEEELVALTLEEQMWATTQDRLPFFGEASLVKLLAATANVPLVHMLSKETLTRDEDTQDHVFEALVQTLPTLEEDLRAQVLTALAPWYARRSELKIPSWIAQQMLQRPGT